MVCLRVFALCVLMSYWLFLVCSWCVCLFSVFLGLVVRVFTSCLFDCIVCGRLLLLFSCVFIVFFRMSWLRHVSSALVCHRWPLFVVLVCF